MSSYLSSLLPFPPTVPLRASGDGEAPLGGASTHCKKRTRHYTIPVLLSRNHPFPYY